jgi:hypothetical protein
MKANKVLAVLPLKYPEQVNHYYTANDRNSASPRRSGCEQQCYPYRPEGAVERA